MKRRCVVCQDPRVEDIDAELRLPKPNKTEIGKRYGIDRQSISKHARNGHVPPVGARSGHVPGSYPEDPALVPAALGSDATSVDRMRAVVARLDSIDFDGLSPAQKLQHLEQQSRALERLHRMEPPRDRERTDLENRLTTLEAKHQAIADVLEAYPAAKAAVGRRLEELRA